jgi:AraC-like DNA-binding protein
MLVLTGSHRRLRVPVTEAIPASGDARISAVWRLPQVMREFGVDVGELLEAVGVPRDIYDDRENRIPYPVLGRLLLECEKRSSCDHVALLICQHTGLADMGLAGRLAFCAETAGAGLQNLIDHFNLSSSASTISLISAGSFSRFVYAISGHGVTSTRQLQLGGTISAYNILRELFGRNWQPTVITVASRPPRNPRTVQRFFQAPLRFNSDESAVIFETRWLDQRLPLVDPLVRRKVEAESRARRAAILSDLPATLRRILRKQLIIGDCSMDQVAAMLRIHRRTLDRHLQAHGIQFGELFESVKREIACQLLRDTDLQVQQVAEALHFSSAANFATAFRRWTAMTPSEYRRREHSG